MTTDTTGVDLALQTVDQLREKLRYIRGELNAMAHYDHITHADRAHQDDLRAQRERITRELASRGDKQ